jgi:hypothetical protein
MPPKTCRARRRSGCSEARPSARRCAAARIRRVGTLPIAPLSTQTAGDPVGSLRLERERFRERIHLRTGAPQARHSATCVLPKELAEDRAFRCGFQLSAFFSLLPCTIATIISQLPDNVETWRKPRNSDATSWQQAVPAHPAGRRFSSAARS